ncbi:MAG: SepM family pheromone-processing serine protease [Bacilli bacterium]
MNVLRKIIPVVLIVAMLGYGLALIPLPFYVTMPGSVMELEPYVDVEDATKSEGVFMLTTVSVAQANIYTYLMPIFNKYYELERMEDMLEEGESEEDYNNRQYMYMSQAQREAMLVAYTAAKEPFKEEVYGVHVLSVAKDMPAYDHLKVGDLITAVDGEDIHDVAAFQKKVQSKGPKDKVKLSIERDGKELDVTLSVAPLAHLPGKYGIGISLDKASSITSDREVDFNIDQIGGPSAGLMFSLEIYDQLEKEDLTKGKKIAGTGTINAEGQVGPIGGIQQKIIAADKDNVEVFFVPNENGMPYSNYLDAKKTVEDIGSSIKLVPVDTFEDALNYLKKMK